MSMILSITFTFLGSVFLLLGTLALLVFWVNQFEKSEERDRSEQEETYGIARSTSLRSKVESYQFFKNRK